MSEDVITEVKDRLNLADLKAQSPKDLLALAEELEIENASTMRKGDMMFSILKERAEDDWVMHGRHCRRRYSRTFGDRALLCFDKG